MSVEEEIKQNVLEELMDDDRIDASNIKVRASSSVTTTASSKIDANLSP